MWRCTAWSYTHRSADQPAPRLRRSAVASAKAKSLALLPEADESLALLPGTEESLALFPRAGESLALFLEGEPFRRALCAANITAGTPIASAATWASWSTAIGGRP